MSQRWIPTTLMALLCVILLAWSAPAYAQDELGPPQAAGAGFASKPGSVSSVGAPIVSYPFELAAGRNPPELALQYMMRGGTLDAGDSWGLSVSSIVRVRRPRRYPELSLLAAGDPNAFLDTIASPLFPYSGVIDRTSEWFDGYEIDGEPLVPVCILSNCPASLENASVAYRGSLNAVFVKKFRNDFTRYLLISFDERSTSELAWIEEKKDGRTRVFGLPRPAGLNWEGSTGATDFYRYDGGDAIPVRWNLSSEFDAVFDASDKPVNETRYYWAHRENEPRGYLTRITYDHDSSSANYASVRFLWEAPGYQTSSYAPAWAARHTRRLSAVEMLGNGGAQLVVRRYRFAYDEPLHEGIGLQNRSFLRSIQMEGFCNKSAPAYPDLTDAKPETPSCALLPATTYEYTQPGLYTLPLSKSIDHIGPPVENSDGLPIEVFSHRDARFLDANRDGRPDVYEPVSSSALPTPHLYLHNGASSNTVFVSVPTSPALDPFGLTPTLVDTQRRGTLDVLRAEFVSPRWCAGRLALSGASWGWQWDPCNDTTRWNRYVSCDERADTDDSCDLTIQNPERPIEVLLAGDFDADGNQDVFEHLADRLTGEWTPEVPRVHLAASGWNRQELLKLPTKARFRASPRATVRLLDFNGDGIDDLLSSERQSGRGVWFGRGDGRFSCNTDGGVGPALAGVAPEPCTYALNDLICVDGSGGACAPGSPLQTSPNLSKWGRHLFHDINGDGLADIILTRGPGYSEDGVGNWLDDQDAQIVYFWVWINEDGRHFHQLSNGGDVIFRAIAPQFAYFGVHISETYPENSTTSFADLDSNGIDDFVLSSVAGITSVDLTGGTIPGLLASVSNGYGQKTTYEYTTVQRYGASRAWTTQSAVVQPILTKMTVLVDGPELVRRQEATTFDYHNPAFDPFRRALVGFEHIAEHSYNRATSVRRYYHSPCENGPGCDDTSWADWTRSFSDTPVEELQTDGTSTTYPYGQVLTAKYNLFKVERGDGIGEAFWTPKHVEQRFYVMTGPGSQSSQTVRAAELVDGRGTTTDQVDIETREWGPNTEIYRWTRSYDSLANLTESVEHGRVTAQMADLETPTVQTYAYERNPERSWQFWVWRYTINAIWWEFDDPVLVRTYEHDSAGQLTRALGELNYVEPDFRRNSAAATVAPMLPSVSLGEVVLANLAYDEFGRLERKWSAPVRTTDGITEECTRYSYDFPWLPAPSRTAQMRGGCNGTEALVTSVQFDAARGLPMSTVTPSGERSSSQYDDFGRVFRSFAPDAVLHGLSSSDWQVEVTYPEAFDGTVPTIGQLRRLERTADGGVRSVVEYLDGAHEHVVTIAQDDNFTGTPGVQGLVASGLTRRNGLNQAIETWRPQVYAGDLDALLGDHAGSQSTQFFYDPLMRHISTWDNGVQQVQRTYTGLLSFREQDGEQLDPSSLHHVAETREEFDGHGRLARRVTGANTTAELVVENTYYPTGEIESSNAYGAGGQWLTWTWSELDSLGRQIVVTHDAAAGVHDAADGIVFGRYDAAGHLVSTTEGRGCGENLYYDSLGRLVARDLSPCEPGQAPYTAPDFFTGDGTEAFYRYDRNEAGATLAGGGSYVGKIASVRDRASATSYVYNARGEVAETTRRVAKPGVPAVALADRYSDSVFHREMEYTIDGQVACQSTGASAPGTLVPGATPCPSGASSLIPGESAVGFTYSKAGRVNSITSSYGALQAFSYDPDGQASAIVYGDLAHTTAQFGYDEFRRAETYRLWRHPPPLWGSYDPASNVVGATNEELVDALYTYDGAHNPTEIRDDRNANLWPSGAKPRTVKLTYDSHYRVTRADYVHGGDQFVSPRAAEEGAGATGDIMERMPAGGRSAWQSMQYNAIGALTATDDDQHMRWDRSLGTVNFTSARTGVASNERVASADGGKILAEYDTAGNLTDLQVVRGAGCSSGSCSYRFQYEWDERGNLAHARRWQFDSCAANHWYSAAGVCTANKAPPVESPGLEITYYSGEDGRVIREASEAGMTPRYTVDVFDSLYLEDAEFVDNKYELNARTQRIVMPGARMAVDVDQVLPLGSLVSTGCANCRVTFVANDQLGSPEIMFDATTSELIEQRTHFPYGATESDFRPARWGAHRERQNFSGKIDDDAVGLVYFGARYYSPHLNQFISLDPVNLMASTPDLNAYAYVRGQTYRSIDPTGLQEQPVQGSAGILSPQQQLTLQGMTLGTWNVLASAQINIGATYTLNPMQFGLAMTRKAILQTTAISFVGPAVLDRIIPEPKVAGAPPPGRTEIANSLAFAVDLGLTVVANVAASVSGSAKVIAQEGVVAIEQKVAELAAERVTHGFTATATKEAVRFTQTTASATFRNGAFAGQTIGDVAGGLRSGAISPSQVPVDTIVRNGNVLMLNTRSTLALMRGGVSPSNWTMVNRTGNAFFEGLLDQRLLQNGLTSAGTDTLRITGGGAGVSVLW